MGEDSFDDDRISILLSHLNHICGLVDQLIASQADGTEQLRIAERIRRVAVDAKLIVSPLSA